MDRIQIPVIESQRTRLLIGYHVVDGFGTIQKTASVELITSSHLFGEPYLLYEVMEATGYLKDPDFKNPEKSSLVITSICPLALDLVTTTMEDRWAAFRTKHGL